MNAPPKRRRRICVVRACDHRHEDGWEHIPSSRPAPTAHLRVVR